VNISETSGETTLLAGEHDAQYPRIAVDASGDVTVVWERYEGANDMVVQAAYRPAGGSWQGGTTTKPKIPSVCQALGVPCVNVLSFLRNQSWSFA
jgi:hypothetical protein